MCDITSPFVRFVEGETNVNIDGLEALRRFVGSAAASNVARQRSVPLRAHKAPTTKGWGRYFIEPGWYGITAVNAPLGQLRIPPCNLAVLASSLRSSATVVASENIDVVDLETESEEAESIHQTASELALRSQADDLTSDVSMLKRSRAKLFNNLVAKAERVPLSDSYFEPLF